ncbi:hypothetical protein FDUTEX481_08969 [Tolypothrix sp. PCC 7601]|nr:hypothetical protein FDUTEX481_08969 [Tolypothrix sp. PCC 7601]
MNIGGGAFCGAFDGTSWVVFLAFPAEVWAAKIKLYMIDKLLNLIPDARVPKFCMLICGIITIFYYFD